MQVAAAGLGVVSSGFGFLSSTNYLNMVKEAGNVIHIAGVETRETVREVGAEARETVRVVGKEARATIQKADEVAQNMIREMNQKVNHSITHARRNAESVVQTTAIEGRVTASHLRLQAQEVLRLASAESNILLARLGSETRDTIRTGSQEFRKTGLLLSSEINQHINNASQQAQTLLRSGGNEVKQLIETATDNLSRLTINTREQYDEFVTNFTREIGACLNTTLDNVSEKLKDFTSHLAEEANGLILNFGDQGRLLIRDTGKEFRVTADKVLKDFFAGQELVIAQGGIEARLVIQEMGKEVRSTLYEIPYIAGKAGENLARGISFGFMDQCYGLKDVDRRIHKLQEYFSKQSASIEQAVRYVFAQDDLPPHIKFQLYKALVEIVNIPENADDMKKILVFIGVMALRDQSLKQRSFCGLRNVDYGDQLIAHIPGEAKTLLREHRENTLWVLYPPKVVEAPLLLVNAVNTEPLEQLIDIKDLESAHLQKELEIARSRNQHLQLEHAEEAVAIEELRGRIEAVTREKDDQIAKLSRQHLLTAQRLEEENNRLKLNLQRLARRANGE